jgi:hypothetical protein
MRMLQRADVRLLWHAISGTIHGGTEPDLLDEVASWQADDDQ